jgi:hypothetical protein
MISLPRSMSSRGIGPEQPFSQCFISLFDISSTRHGSLRSPTRILKPNMAHRLLSCFLPCVLCGMVYLRTNSASARQSTWSFLAIDLTNLAHVSSLLWRPGDSSAKAARAVWSVASSCSRFAHPTLAKILPMLMLSQMR